MTYVAAASRLFALENQHHESYVDHVNNPVNVMPILSRLQDFDLPTWPLWPLSTLATVATLLWPLWQLWPLLQTLGWNFGEQAGH